MPPEKGLIRESNGSVCFMGLDLRMGGHVLRPRVETELLARAAQEVLVEAHGSPVCVDMCCGSGNLAIALATFSPGATIWASDLTDGAVATARHNVELRKLGSRVTIVQGDMFAPLAGRDLEGAIDLVVANPPYISTRRLVDGDRAYLLENEPREAFDGGPYGIALHQRLISESPVFLKSGGWLGFEFGVGQERQIAALLKRSRAFREPVWHSNDAGEPRVAFVRKRA